MPRTGRTAEEPLKSFWVCIYDCIRIAKTTNVAIEPSVRTTENVTARVFQSSVMAPLKHPRQSLLDARAGWWPPIARAGGKGGYGEQDPISISSPPFSPPSSACPCCGCNSTPSYVGDSTPLCVNDSRLCGSIRPAGLGWHCIIC